MLCFSFSVSFDIRTDNRFYLPFLHTKTYWILSIRIENEIAVEMETWCDFNQWFVHFLNRFNRTAHQPNIMNVSSSLFWFFLQFVTLEKFDHSLLTEKNITRSVSVHKCFNNGRVKVGITMWWWPDKLNNKKWNLLFVRSEASGRWWIWRWISSKQTKFTLWKLIVSHSMTVPVPCTDLHNWTEMRQQTIWWAATNWLWYFFIPFRLLNSFSFFVCVIFLACQLTCLRPLYRAIGMGKSTVLTSKQGEHCVNQINEHRRALILSEILSVAINLVLVMFSLKKFSCYFFVYIFYCVRNVDASWRRKIIFYN